jgi:hypothetical protein
VAELLLVPAHQVLDFGPRGDEWHPDNILVELASCLLIVGDVGVVVEARRRCVRGVCRGGGHGTCLLIDDESPHLGYQGQEVLKAMPSG